MLPGVTGASGTEMAYDQAGARLLVASVVADKCRAAEYCDAKTCDAAIPLVKGDTIVQIGESPNVGNDNDAVTATVQQASILVPLRVVLHTDTRTRRQRREAPYAAAETCVVDGREVGTSSLEEARPRRSW